LPKRNGASAREAQPVRRAKPSVSNKPIGKRGLLDQFHNLERNANVSPVHGRGWYGTRRKATDVYEDYETDERIINDQTGHQSSDTRRTVYQEKEREEIRARSARTRRRVRAAAFRPKPAANGGSESTGASPEGPEEVVKSASSYP